MSTKQKASKLDAYAERLDEMFLAGKTLAEAQEELRLDGCSVSLSRLSDWWSTRQSMRMEERLLTQIASGARQCKEVEAQLGKAPAPDMATLMALHRSLILGLSTQATANPELLELVNRMMDRVMKLMRLDQLAEQNRLDARRLALLEKRAEQAGEAEATVKSDLSDQDKIARMKAVFGIAT